MIDELKVFFARFILIALAVLKREQKGRNKSVIYLRTEGKKSKWCMEECHFLRRDNVLYKVVLYAVVSLGWSRLTNLRVEGAILWKTARRNLNFMRGLN